MGLTNSSDKRLPLLLPPVLLMLLVGALGALLFWVLAVPILGVERLDSFFDKSDDLNRIVSDLNRAVDDRQLPDAFCGNRICETGENLDTCFLDCFICNGNGQCETDIGETNNSCPSDCSDLSGLDPVDGFCGDNFCASTESCNTCTLDCGVCTEPVCGNNLIEENEFCDGTALSGATCNSIPGDYNGGTLFCNNSCTGYVITSCTRAVTTTEICTDNIDNDGDNAIDCNDLDCTACAGFFNMKIETISGDNTTRTITTTGAEYKITQNQIELWRRIDPTTNTINPRLVGRITFTQPLGTILLASQSHETLVLQTPTAEFTFNSDSLFTIKANTTLDYTHTNLVTNAPWNKGTGTDRMWTDGYGGTLHAKWSGNPTATSQTTDTTTLHLNPNDTIAHMAYPPKPFDFEKLYNGRSTVLGSVTPSWLAIFNSAESPLDEMAADGVGVIFVWNAIYVTGDFEPEPLPSGVIGYRVKPELENTFRTFIANAHQKGFKVITYMTYPARFGQPTDTTIAWMKQFQEQYNLDGWYFDNADAGAVSEDYRFMRTVRRDVGDDGILYHHNSVDVWGHWNGLRAIMVDAYVDYMLTGETGRQPPNVTAQINDPNDAYLRYFTSGYGLSQAFGSLKRRSDSKLAISEEEKNRVMGAHLHGSEVARTYEYELWKQSFKPAQEMARQKYAQGTGISPDWPVSSQNGWYRTASNFNVAARSGTSVTLSWNTSQNADSLVSYTSNGVWWPPSDTSLAYGPAGIEEHNALETTHSIVLSNLTPNTTYDLRIRSSNRTPALASEIIWGQMGSFTTGAADSDSDGLPDDWELHYFSSLSEIADGNPDADQFTNAQELANKTNPALSDSANACNYNSTCDAGLGETIRNCRADCSSGGLVADWRFDDPLGRNNAGENYALRNYGAQWHSNGGHDNTGNYAFDPDSTAPNDFLEISTPIPATNAFTITGWIKRTRTGVIDFITGSSASYSAVHGTDQLIFLYTDTSGEYNTCYGARITDTQWHHVAFRSDGSQLSIFLDGVNTTNPTYCTHPVQSGGIDLTKNLVQYVGRFASNYMKGNLDDVAVWNRALTDTEICQLADAC